MGFYVSTREDLENLIESTYCETINLIATALLD